MVVPRRVVGAQGLGDGGWKVLEDHGDVGSQATGLFGKAPDGFSFALKGLSSLVQD